MGEFAPYTVAGALEISDINARAFTDKAQLLEYLQLYLASQQAQPCTVLFKGSRFMEMETLINALVEE